MLTFRGRLIAGGKDSSTDDLQESSLPASTCDHFRFSGNRVLVLRLRLLCVFLEYVVVVVVDVVVAAGVDDGEGVDDGGDDEISSDLDWLLLLQLVDSIGLLDCDWLITSSSSSEEWCS